jgi:hypothetical protein
MGCGSLDRENAAGVIAKYRAERGRPNVPPPAEPKASAPEASALRRPLGAGDDDNDKGRAVAPVEAPVQGDEALVAGAAKVPIEEPVEDDDAHDAVEAPGEAPDDDGDEVKSPVETPVAARRPSLRAQLEAWVVYCDDDSSGAGWGSERHAIEYVFARWRDRLDSHCDRLYNFASRASTPACCRRGPRPRRGPVAVTRDDPPRSLPKQRRRTTPGRRRVPARVVLGRLSVLSYARGRPGC